MTGAQFKAQYCPHIAEDGEMVAAQAANLGAMTHYGDSYYTWQRDNADQYPDLVDEELEDEFDTLRAQAQDFARRIGPAALSALEDEFYTLD